MMRVIGVVGPSGVGKDTVMAALMQARPGLYRARRVITRPALAGGEAFCPVDEAGFDRMVAAGDFALWWKAHGLRYGVRVAEIAEKPERDAVLVNLSRGVLDQARVQFDGFRILSLRAKPEVLAARLADRGRETKAGIAARLARADHLRPAGQDVIEISNDGALQDTVMAILRALYPERA
ncbi:phosphonate metabolism protein/1,5-bisphosphokinase (PRPP-forming) PhnN [Shimia sp.]|uniref:phosphonate metabolism protein/1,5-bisphosphokinase (PRPP-forming) PhnN n=1 Tax=Shimia sp. TaxID=1954381 RepID=UPI003297010A